MKNECNRVVEKIHLLLTNEKFDIRETKGGSFLVRVSVLPRLKKEEKDNDDHICNSNKKAI